MTESNKEEIYPCHIDWQVYYKLQYERIQQHETQRVQFSGLIMTGSLAALAILIRADQKISGDGLVAGAFTIVAVNLICIFFVQRSRKWVKFHQERARVLLETCEPSLLLLMKKEGPEKPGSDWDFFGRSALQIWLHLMLIVSPIVVWQTYS